MRRIALIPLLVVCLTGCAAVATRAVGAAQRPDVTRMFEAADMDGDGRITRAEFTQAQDRLFEKLDRNGDGAVSSGDAPRRLRARRGGGDGAGGLARALDADGDGRIDRDEFVDGALKLFDRADTDRDGAVDTQELAALRAAAAARRAG